MLAHEAEIGFEPDTFGADLVGRRLHQRGDMIAELLAHIADERLEDFLFRIEIGVEAAERGSGAARNRADRRFEKAALAEFDRRSEEHTSELQSLMRISYAVFCLKNNNDMEKVNHTTYRLSYMRHS